MSGHIRPGLTRIRQLITNTPQTWPAIHIAGTNGKGSVCVYLSAMLREVGLRVGRFTSPHLIDRWDGIVIDDKPITKALFMSLETRVKERNEADKIAATSFELLTATALEAFTSEKVDVAVVECGMGGANDATNVLERPIATAITSVGLDHQEYLGTTTGEIAGQKAGIMRNGILCVVSPSLDDAARTAVEEIARSREAPLYTAPPQMPDVNEGKEVADTANANKSMAFAIFQQVFPQLQHLATTRPLDLQEQEVPSRLLSAMDNAPLYGRQQVISLERLTGRKQPVILDGAHNAEAWQALARRVNLERDRPPILLDKPDRNGFTTIHMHNVFWILAQSKGKHKHPAEPISILCQADHDSIFFTEFSPVEGMPWVKPVSREEFEKAMEPGSDPGFGHPDYQLYSTGDDNNLRHVLQYVCDLAKGAPIVIAGSLYLVGDVLRLLRDAGETRYCPPVSDSDAKTPTHRGISFNGCSYRTS